MGESRRKMLAASCWASFVADPFDKTLFVGLYQVKSRRLLDIEVPEPHIDELTKPGTADIYDLELLEEMKEFIGKLYIEWGPGKRSWVQYADRKQKVVTELRATVAEPTFPGYLRFVERLSTIQSLPSTWRTALEAATGIYLLTCPKTKEQYVGSACGDAGFWGRWIDYCADGHGGNVALKSRSLEDYQVCILEVAGSAASADDILRAEGLWQTKLQSREMGLNRNLAHLV